MYSSYNKIVCIYDIRTIDYKNLLPLKTAQSNIVAQKIDTNQSSFSTSITETLTSIERQRTFHLQALSKREYHCNLILDLFNRLQSLEAKENERNLSVHYAYIATHALVK